MKEVVMYRVECDDETCDASPQEEFYAWREAGTALEEATHADWYVSEDSTRHLCEIHSPQCPHEDCGVFLRDDEFGIYCEDHAPDKCVHPRVGMTVTTWRTAVPPTSPGYQESTTRTCGACGQVWRD